MSTTGNDQATGILTMVYSTDEPTIRYVKSPEQVAADQKQEAARTLAPLITAMRETGLLDAGYKVALAKHMIVDWNPGEPATSAVRDRLNRARDILSGQVNLLLLPDAVIIYEQEVMPLLGSPSAGRIWGKADGSPYELF